MKITPPQLDWFWSNDGWPAIVRKYGWDKEEAEYQRKAMLLRAGNFKSLKDVDKMQGFTNVKKEMAALLKPSDLAEQMRLEQMPRQNFIHGRRAQADEAYLVALAASPRFKCSDWTALPEDQWDGFSKTVKNRVASHRFNHLVALVVTAARYQKNLSDALAAFVPVTAENTPF